jgi:hypothetical protein
VVRFNEVLAQLRAGQPVPEYLRKLLPAKIWSKLFQVLNLKFYVLYF